MHACVVQEGAARAKFFVVQETVSLLNSFFDENPVQIPSVPNTSECICVYVFSGIWKIGYLWFVTFWFVDFCMILELHGRVVYEINRTCKVLVLFHTLFSCRQKTLTGCLHRFACLSGLVRVDDVLIYTCFTVLGPLPPHKCCWYVREVKIENPDFSKHIYLCLSNV